MRRRLLLAAPLLAAAAAPPAARARRPLAATPIDRLATRWWAARHAAKLKELRAGPTDLLWLGDSITQDWEKAGPPAALDFRPVWDRFYAGRNAVNLGFKGDATSHLLWRLANGQLDAIRPKAAVMLIGANNFGRLRWSAADTLAGIEACLAECRRRASAMAVLLLSVLPSDRGPWTASATAEVNRLLVDRFGNARVPGVTFMDVTALYLSNGALDRSLFYDPPDPALHPTAQAHARLAAHIEPRLAALLGDRPRT